MMYDQFGTSHYVIHVDCSVRVGNVPEEIERARDLIEKISAYARRLGAATFCEESEDGA